MVSVEAVVLRSWGWGSGRGAGLQRLAIGDPERLSRPPCERERRRVRRLGPCGQWPPGAGPLPSGSVLGMKVHGAGL